MNVLCCAYTSRRRAAGAAMVSWDCGANLSGMALSSWTGSQSSRLRPLCLHTAVPLWTAGCVGSCDRIETGLVLCPHESLCHLHVSPSGRTVISGTVLLVSYIPCPYMVPECPSPVTTRPRPHVATTDRSLSREKKVARRVCRGQSGLKILTGWLGVLKAGVAVGPGGVPWGIRQALRCR